MADMKFSLLLKADGAGNVTGQLKHVENAVKGVDGGTKNLAKSQNELKRTTDQATASLKETAVSLTSLKSLFATLGIAAFIQKIGQASDSIASFERGISAVSPSLGDATKSMDFVAKMADKMGLNLRDTREAFLGLASATQGTALAGEATRKVFESVTKAGALMGKTSEQIKLGFLGISQMATLQVVSFEEVRQVMENLGISLTTIAKSMKMTTQEFKEATAKGKILATDLLPALAVELDKLSGKAEGTATKFGSAWNRMVNEWEKLLNALGQSGVVDAMAVAFSKLASAITAITEPAATLTKTLFSLKNEIGTVVAALGTMLIVSKVASGFMALQAALAGTSGVTAALTSLNAVAAVAFGPAGWIAIGAGLLAGLVIQMNALKGQSVQLVEVLSQGNRLKSAGAIVSELKGKITDLQKELDKLAYPGTSVAKNIIDQPRVKQIVQEINAAQESLKKWSDAEGRWASDLAEGERKAAEEAARLKKEQEELAKSLEKPAKKAKDTRSELEKLNVPYAKLIEQYSELYGIMPKVTAAVMKAESGFKAMAESGKGAAGLMQVMPSTFVAMLGKAATKITDVNQNIEAGTKYLAIQIKTFGDLPKALAAYNAGPGKVAEAIKLGAREGITWWDAFLKLFPKAAKETGPYIEKVLANLKAYGEGKESVEMVSDAFKNQQEILQQTALAMAELDEQQAAYQENLYYESIAAWEDYLKASDPEGYKQRMREIARADLDAEAAKLALSDAEKQAAQAAQDATFYWQDQLEKLQLRESWAQSFLQGFDQLWSNMISGAENAMEALQETLKSWLYAIGQWLLKQTLIIPVTAAMFGVSQQSLGGGLFGQTGAAGKGGSGIGSVFSNFGNMFGGYGISGGFQDVFQGIGRMIGSESMSMATVGVPNWGYGLSALGSYAVSSLLFKNKGYSGIGSQIGGAIGTAIGSVILPGIGTIIGSILGSTGGGFLGGLFGGEPVPKGGVSYWNAAEGAGAAHEDASASATSMLEQMGQVMTALSDAVNKMAGYDSGIMGDFWMDVGDAGIKMAYNSFVRGMQKAEGFGSEGEAGEWLMDEMMKDFKIRIGATGSELADSISAVFGRMDTETLMNQLGTFSSAIEDIMDLFSTFSGNLKAETESSIQLYAASVDDIVGIMMMARDVNRGYADSLFDVATGIFNIKQEGESLADAYQRSIQQYQEYRNALLIANKGLVEFNSSTIELSDSLATAAGGVNNLASLQSFYFENFYTEAERLAVQQRLAAQDVALWNEQLGRAGDAVIDTKDELKAYIEALDLTTEAGQIAYVDALNMAAAINTLGMTLDETGNVVEETAETVEDFQDELNSIMREVSRTLMSSDLERALDDINYQYEAMIKSATEYGATEEQLNQIRMAQQKELDAAYQQATESYQQAIQALYESNKQLINLWYNTITTTNNLLSISGQEAKNAEAAAMALINVTYSMLQSGQTTVEQNIGFIEDSIASLVEWGNTVKATEDAWNNFADSLQSTIDQLRFSTESPVSESGQLMALDQEIARVQAQYATATGQEQVDLANELASLYQQQLSLGSQVYDRTSQEYMDLYNSTMQSLNSLNLQAQDEAAKQTALLQDIVDSINGFAYWESLLLTQQIEADAKAVQDAAALLQLNETQNALLQTVIDTSIYNKDAIVGALSGVPQYAEGTAYVPQTGLYKLHQGEQVIPVRSRTDGEPVITINLTVNGAANGQDVQTAVRRMLPEIKRSLKRN